MEFASEFSSFESAQGQQWFEQSFRQLRFKVMAIEPENKLISIFRKATVQASKHSQDGESINANFQIHLFDRRQVALYPTFRLRRCGVNITGFSFGHCALLANLCLPTMALIALTSHSCQQSLDCSLLGADSLAFDTRYAIARQLSW